MLDNPLEERLLKALIDDWGYVVGNAGLRQSLGFPTQSALRQAIARGDLPIQVFCIQGRKGWFALAHDLAAWLSSRGSASPPPATSPSSSRRPRTQK